MNITPVWLSPSDARAAFERKAVDARAIWDPFLAVAQATASARIIANGTGVVANRAYYFTSRNYVQKNDDVLRAVLAEIGAADRWIAANRDKAASEFSQLWGIQREIVEVVLARLRYGTEPVSHETLADQQRIADVFFELKLLPRKIDVAEAAPPSPG